MYKTNFPEWVQRSIGAKWVLVVKNTMDFALEEPEDLEGVTEHVKWFHSFWWEKNSRTHPQCIAFYDTLEEALEGGHSWATRAGEWNWAVYASDRRLVDGCY